MSECPKPFLVVRARPLSVVFHPCYARQTDPPLYFGVVSCARTDVCSPTIEISTGSRNLFITTPDLLVVEASAIHQSRVEDALDEVSVNASSSIGGAASTVNEKNVASISAMPKVRVPADKPTAIQANVKMASD